MLPGIRKIALYSTETQIKAFSKVKGMLIYSAEYSNDYPILFF